MAVGGAEDDKGAGRGLWGQGCVFADFIRCCWLSEGCGRCRRPCPRLLHSEPSRLAVVTAFSLKLAATLAGAEHSESAALSVAAAVGGSEHSEHSEHSAGVDAGADAEGASVVTAGAAGDSAHSAGVGAGMGVVSVGGGVAAARI